VTVLHFLCLFLTFFLSLTLTLSSSSPISHSFTHSLFLSRILSHLFHLSSYPFSLPLTHPPSPLLLPLPSHSQELKLQKARQANDTVTFAPDYVSSVTAEQLRKLNQLADRVGRYHKTTVAVFGGVVAGTAYSVFGGLNVAF
jgi:hypothetical protein